MNLHSQMMSERGKGHAADAINSSEFELNQILPSYFGKKDGHLCADIPLCIPLACIQDI